jgi:FkbM family methyltransferase
MLPLVHAIVWASRHYGKKYVVPELGVIVARINASDIVLDVGAHAGSWTVPLSKFVTQGQVYAFEGLPYYAQALSWLTRVLGLRNVTVVAAAVCDKEGSVELVAQDSSGQHLTGRTHIRADGESSPSQVVPAVTLDGYFASNSRRIGFIKVDVEGAELPVLRGAKAILTRCRPVLFLEVNEDMCLRCGYTFRELFSFLQELNYRAFTVVGSEILPCSADTYSGSGDVLFLQADQCEGLG